MKKKQKLRKKDKKISYENDHMSEVCSVFIKIQLFILDQKDFEGLFTDVVFICSELLNLGFVVELKGFGVKNDYMILNRVPGANFNGQVVADFAT